MWYVATRKVAGRKTRPHYEVRYVESEDGLTAWSEPSVLFGADEGFYDAVVTAPDSRYEMVTCRSGNIAGKASFLRQGIWWLASDTPSGDRSDWTSVPVQLLDPEDGTEYWYENGITDTSVQYEGGTMFVFFTGVDGETNWLRMAKRRLLRLKPPPIPAPFYISIGRVSFARR